MKYQHTVLVPKTLVFEIKMIKCPKCKELMEKHIVCEGARFHVLSWDSNGSQCSVPECEYNHRRRHREELGK